MSKRLIAAFLVAVFIIGIALTATPIQAHTTLGRPTGTVPYAVRDSDTNGGHVPGPTGYVWPGGGKDWWTGVLTEPPGYQNPWGNYPAAAPLTWWQLRGNTYAPFGAILASTDDHPNTGDLIFAINFTTHGLNTAPKREAYVYYDVILYIPPEFELYNNGDPSAVATTINVPYGGNYIQVVKADVKDPFGPGWWIVKVPGNLTFTAENYPEWYYIRINNVNAPKIAGRYIFKIFLNSSFPLGNSVEDDGSIADWGYVLSTMPAENWPCLLVKGEIDPGIVEGTVFALGWDPNLREKPLWLPGKVELVGEAYDPYTWEPLGREVRAMGYFNASAQGHYVVEGVAPGVYDVYVSAAGYPRMKSASGVEVHPGKSVHLNVVLQPGAIVHGKIFSKHAYGEVEWGKQLPVMVEIYDSNDWPEPFRGAVWGNVEGTVPDNWLDWEFEHLKSFSPINLTDSPYTSYVWGNVAFDGDGNGVRLNPEKARPRNVSFPWEGDDTIASGFGKDPDGIFNGVGASQPWWTNPTSAQFEFRFGNKDYTNHYGIYGAPTEFDGHVPQVFATWVNGLEPGTYYLRAWINGYVQTDASGNYVDYMFTVASQEWAGDIYVPMDLQLTGWINKTVHFQSGAGSMKEVPAAAGDGFLRFDENGNLKQSTDKWRFLIVEARDAAGTLVAFNFTQVDYNYNNTVIQLNGFGMAGPLDYDDWDWQEFPAPAHKADFGPDPWIVSPVGMKFFLYKYRHIRDYGLMPGTYKIYAYMRGFVEQEWELASVSLSGAPTQISDHLYLGAGINITIYSIDWQHPRVDRTWMFGPMTFPPEITVDVYNSEGVKMGDVRYFYDPNNDGVGRWSEAKQVSGEKSVPYPGCGYQLKFHGAPNLERFGPEETIGLYTPDVNDEAATCWESFYFGLGFLYLPAMYRDAEFKTTIGLETDTYHFDAYTYGYVFKEPDKYALFVAKGTQGDTKINLVQGVNFTYTIIFKKEGIIEGIPYDMWIQVQFFDEDGNLVATATPGWPNYKGHYAIKKGTPMITGETAGLWDGDNSWGVDGFPNYVGEYSVKVILSYQLMDWYHNIYYPPPPGIMMGMWGDSAVGKWGPYEMRTEVTIPNVHLGGEASIQFELDQRALLTGQIAGFTWSNELRPVSWASVSVSGEAGELTVYSFDGKYELYVPRGDYDMVIEVWPNDAGYHSQTVSVTAPDGGTASYNFLNMERSGIAIPEFPAVAVALISAIGASLYVLKRRKAEK